METEKRKDTGFKPFIIANPIYDTVFRKLMENLQIVKIFLSVILERQVTAVDVLPQKFTYKEEKEAIKKAGKIVPYSIYRGNFIATVPTESGEYQKILVEIRKSLETLNIYQFRKYLGEQYIETNTVIVDNVNKGLEFPVTTIYMIGHKLTEIKCSCRTYTDTLTNETVAEKDDFVEKLTHDFSVIHAGKITDDRPVTRLEKLLSIFEQRYFFESSSEAVKVYRYQPAADDEEIMLITKTLHETGVDPEEWEHIRNEAEYIRTIDDTYGSKIREQLAIIEEKDRKLEELMRRLNIK
jgi:hypothetical protein